MAGEKCKDPDCGTALKWAWEVTDNNGYCGACGPGSAKWQAKHGTAPGVPPVVQLSSEEIKRKVLAGEALPPGTIAPGQTLRFDD